MVRWSRVRLAVSILLAEGLWRSWLDRFKYAQPDDSTHLIHGLASHPPARPPEYIDYSCVAHIHSTYSDGTGSVAEIAASAAQAGVDIVLLTDHNTLDAASSGEQTWYEDGHVLMVVGTEATTNLGHLLAFNIAEDVIPLPHDAVSAMSSITESGGYGYIALPLDLKGHWKDFTARLPGIGIEVFNLSSIARTKINVPGFLLALARYRGKDPVSAFSLVVGRPEPELRLWDDMLCEATDRGEALPSAIGSLDAHAVMRIARQEYPYPTYEQVFRTLRTHILAGAPLSRSREHVADDLAIVHEALSCGRSYVSFDNFADARGFRFEVMAGDDVIGSVGETCNAGFGTDAPLSVCADMLGRKCIVRLFRNGRVYRVARGTRIRISITTPGVYRVEVYLYKSRIGNFCWGARPWIFSNAINVVAHDANQIPGHTSIDD